MQTVPPAWDRYAGVVAARIAREEAAIHLARRLANVLIRDARRIDEVWWYVGRVEDEARALGLEIPVAWMGDDPSLLGVVTSYVSAYVLTYGCGKLETL